MKSKRNRLSGANRTNRYLRGRASLRQRVEERNEVGDRTPRSNLAYGSGTSTNALDVQRTAGGSNKAFRTGGWRERTSQNYEHHKIAIPADMFGCVHNPSLFRRNCNVTRIIQLSVGRLETIRDCPYRNPRPYTALPTGSSSYGRTGGGRRKCWQSGRRFSGATWRIWNVGAGNRKDIGETGECLSGGVAGFV